MGWMHRLPRKRRLLLLVLRWTVLLWFASFHSANAQFFSPQSGGESAGGLAGNRVQERMDKKKKGTNITEWVRRLRNDRPETRLEAVKSLGDSKDPKAIEHLVGA